jgi:hypothetical protein
MDPQLKLHPLGLGVELMTPEKKKACRVRDSQKEEGNGQWAIHMTLRPHKLVRNRPSDSQGLPSACELV